MFKSKLFWYGMFPGSIAGWIFAVYGFIVPITNETVRTIWIGILCVWLIGHPLELLISIPIGKKAGISVFKTVIKTIILGFTWWAPVKLGVFDS